MPNLEHLTILEQGVTEWNVWRKCHPDIRPDLAKAELVDQSLRGIDLNSADLEEADLSRTDLTNSTLRSLFARN
jgi:uncharacterized protein YjbI with pentapeptide repeats